MELIQQRCRRHEGREAVARCLECHGFFCRECATEHEGRILCSDCLAKISGGKSGKSGVVRWFLRGSGGFVGLFLIWLFFYGWGKFLLSLPADFHDGNYWMGSSAAETEEEKQ